MEFRDVLFALRARWWLPLVGMVVAGAGALGFSSLQTPLYTATTQLFVSTADSSSAADALQGGQFSEQRVTSYARLLTGEDMAGRVVGALGLRLTPDQLRDEIRASPVADTVLLEVTVTDPDPRRAQLVASAIGTQFTTYVSELEAPRAGGASPVQVTVTESPRLPSAPSSPQTDRDVALGLLAGLALGAATAIIRARLDRSVRDADALTEIVGAPVIGTVLRDETLAKQHTTDRGVGDRAAEDFRQLRTNLQFLNVDEPPKVIMVSSALPSEGKTTVVVNLALALADTGRRVIVVEADLRRPKVTRYLGLVTGAGLTNILAGTAELDEVVQAYTERLSVIAAGPIPPNPGELLASSHMATVVDKLRSQYDYVLVDAPPVLPVADATAMAVRMDGVLLSVRYGSTRKDHVRQAAAALDRVGAKLLGVILNIVPVRAGAATAYGYGYSYDQAAPQLPLGHSANES